jgi:nitroreductase
MKSKDAIYLFNDTLLTIRKRRSIRMFTKNDLSDEQIAALLQAANEAPSAHNQQSWRFIVLRKQKKQELADLVAAQSEGFPRPASALLRMAARSIASAPVVIAVANTGDLIDHGTDLFKVNKEMAHDFFRTMEIQSSAAAVQNMLLAATSIGLATVWLGILFLIKDDVLKFIEERASREGGGPKKEPFEMKVRYLD